MISSGYKSEFCARITSNEIIFREETKSIEYKTKCCFENSQRVIVPGGKIFFMVRGTVIDVEQNKFPMNSKCLLHLLVNESLLQSSSQFKNSVVEIDCEPSNFRILLSCYLFNSTFLSIKSSNLDFLNRLVESEANFLGYQELLPVLDFCASCGDLFLFSRLNSCTYTILHQSPKYEEYKSSFYLSSIGLSTEYIALIKQWIFEITGFKNKHFNMKFSAIENGFKTTDFFNVCSNVSRLLIIVKTVSGYIFGGFTSSGFDMGNEDKIDNHSFLFTISNPHNLKPVKLVSKYNKFVGPKAMNKKQSIGFGAVKGAADLGLFSESNEKGGWCNLDDPESGYCDTTGKGSELFTGNKIIGPILNILAFQM